MINPFETINARLSNIESLLIDLKHPPITKVGKEQPDELLTVQGAAQFLSLSAPTIYGLISKGEIPYMKKSKRVYFSRQDLMHYLRAGRKKTVAEIEAETDTYLAKKKGGIAR